MIEQKQDGFDQARKNITTWIAFLRDLPGFHEWKKRTISVTMCIGDPWFDRMDKPPEEFAFPPLVAKQHEAIMAFLSLYTTWQALADTEFYFRRYPFDGLPVSMDTHLRYTCETYFSRIYEFKERLKKALNAINEVIPRKVDAGSLIRQFNNDFDQEIRERNQIHHHDRFDDIVIDRIGLEGMMAQVADGDRGWKSEQRITYRKATKEWADRARRRSSRVREYLSAVGEIVTRECKFLTDPIAIDAH
jgi:hypothetical protein